MVILKVGEAKASQELEVNPAKKQPEGPIPTMIEFFDTPSSARVGQEITLNARAYTGTMAQWEKWLSKVGLWKWNVENLLDFFGVSAEEPLKNAKVDFLFENKFGYLQAISKNSTGLKTDKNGEVSFTFTVFENWLDYQPITLVAKMDKQSLSPLTIQGSQTTMSVGVSEEPTPPVLPDTKEECEAQGYYWYNNACHKEPEGPGIGMGIVLLGAVVLLMAKEK